MTRDDEGPMFGILRSVPSGCRKRLDRLLEVQNGRRRPLVAPLALRGLLHRCEVAQQRRNLPVQIEPWLQPSSRSWRPAQPDSVANRTAVLWFPRGKRHAHPARRDGGRAARQHRPGRRSSWCGVITRSRSWPARTSSRAAASTPPIMTQIRAWCDGIGEAVRQLADLPAARRARLSRRGGARAVRGGRRAARADRRAAPSCHSAGADVRTLYEAYRHDVHGGRRTLRAVVEARAPAARARLARRLCALGDAAGRHAPLRYPVLRDTRAARSRRPRTNEAESTDSTWMTAGGRAGGGRQRRRSSCRRRPGRRSASSKRFTSVDAALAWARTRKVGPARAEARRRGRARGCSCCPAIRCNPDDREPVTFETRFRWVDDRWRPERAALMAGDHRGCAARSAFRDLLLFYIVTTFSLRWMATAAAAGPSALVIWVIAAAGLFVPLVFTTLELSSRYPEEGGIYVWSKRAFGPFAGFITGWSTGAPTCRTFRRCCISPPATCCSSAGHRGRRWSSSSAYFIAVVDGRPRRSRSR